MRIMSAASEIAKNVWLGPTPEAIAAEHFPEDDDSVIPYEFLIECNEMAPLPNRSAFTMLEKLATSDLHKDSVPQLEFPGSGSIMPPTWSQLEADGLLATIEWVYQQANGIASTAGTAEVRKRKDSRISITADRDADGDSIMTIEQPTPSRRFLLHCADGYTETTLLAVAYYMYANCVPLHTAYIDLHKQYKRNFFAYPSDIALLSAIQPRLLTSSPAAKGFSLTDLSPPTPEWMRKVDGSIPSRITDYMYLGNLAHANNPGLLKAMGIGQVLSVGETLDWTDEAKSAFCKDKPFACTDDSDGKWLFVGGVQDNGVDPLTEEFARCLEFIRNAHPPHPHSAATNPRSRQRPRRRHRHPGALPRRRLALGHHLHRRGHERARPLLPKGLLLRARPPPQRHHPAAPALQLRAAQVRGAPGPQARPPDQEGARVGHDRPGDCRDE